MRTAFKSIAYVVPFQERKDRITSPEISVAFNDLISGHALATKSSITTKEWTRPSVYLPIVGTGSPSKGVAVVHMEAIMAVFPKEYDAVCDKIKKARDELR